MKEIEISITDAGGWTIFPPEHTQKAQRWIEAAEASPEPATTADSAGDRRQNHKVDSKKLFQL